MGKEDYRNTVLRTRTIAGDAAVLRGVPDHPEKLPDDAHIMDNTEAIRILGGWIGYNIDLDNIWDKTVKKMDEAHERWAKRRLTLQGKKLIVNFIILSRAQYLMMVNDPTPKTVKRITDIVRKTMWNGKAKSVIKMDDLHRHVDEGGFNLSNFEARQTAARLTWIKKWQTNPAAKPQWTLFLEDLLRITAKADADPRRTSIFTQDWREKKGHKSKLSKEIRDMLKDAMTHGVAIDGLRFRSGNKDQLPIWFSLFSRASKEMYKDENAKRLYEKHGVITQGDLIV